MAKYLKTKIFEKTLQPNFEEYFVRAILLLLSTFSKLLFKRTHFAFGLNKELFLNLRQNI